MFKVFAVIAKYRHRQAPDTLWHGPGHDCSGDHLIDAVQISYFANIYTHTAIVPITEATTVATAARVL
jgi:hypothetical protein